MIFLNVGWKSGEGAATEMRRLGAILAILMVAGCGSQEISQQFDQTLKGNSQFFKATPSAVLAGAQVALVDQGFTIESQSGSSATAKRELQDANDSKISYVTSASVVVVPEGADRAEVSMSANQQTFLHKEDRIWWHLFWLIPLFPIGTQYQTVLRRQDTISDPDFYNRFFTTLKKHLDEMSEEQPPAPRPAGTAP